MTDVTFDNLRLRYRTGRSYTISGTGRDRVTGYRQGVCCRLGDIEAPEWYQMVHSLIKEKGEAKLFDNLQEYLKDHNHAKLTKAELEHEALELHAARIFDDPLWVGFLEFNRRHRPKVLDGVKLVWIQPSCCPKPGQTTMALVERHREIICCPHCGRWSNYVILTNYEMEEHTCV